MVSLSELISEKDMALLQGDQIPLPIAIEPPKPKYWLRVDHQGCTYTYDECKKVFTLEDWDAKPFPNVGRAKATIYALRQHKQLKGKGELAGSTIYVYDAVTKQPVDYSPPEPELPALKFPLCDNADRLPWCPECGAMLLKPYTVCGTCNWDASPQPTAYSPQIDALKQRITQLLHQIDGIKRAGAIAPKGCSLEPYYVSKKLANGKKERFKYYRMKSEGEALFQNTHGQATKSLHLGTESSPAYKDWRDRVQRRNAIALLERHLDKAERKLQTLKG